MYGKGITNDSDFIERALSSIREFMEEDGRRAAYERFIAPASASVQFAIARDPQARLRFAAVQSPLGQAFLARQSLPLDVYESFYFVEQDVVYEKSTAWLRLLRYLQWPWPWFRVLALVP